MNLLENIKESIINMDEEKVREFTKKALENNLKPETIIFEALTPAMDLVGQEYEKGNLFLPEMLMSAESLRGAMDLIQPLLIQSGGIKAGKVVMGTVEGDIHDIGKQIVCLMLEGAGFEVFDLGVDVPAKTFVEKAKQEEADIVGMSAFLSTTALQFSEVIRCLEEANLRDKVKIMIGGAAASDHYAGMIGADGYGSNASVAVKLARELTKRI